MARSDSVVDLWTALQLLRRRDRYPPPLRFPLRIFSSVLCPSVLSSCLKCAFFEVCTRRSTSADLHLQLSSHFFLIFVFFFGLGVAERTGTLKWDGMRSESTRAHSLFDGLAKTSKNKAISIFASSNRALSNIFSRSLALALPIASILVVVRALAATFSPAPLTPFSTASAMHNQCAGTLAN